MLGLSTPHPDPQDPTSSARGKVNPDPFFPLAAESNTPTPAVLAPPKPLLELALAPPGNRALAAPGVGEEGVLATKGGPAEAGAPTGDRSLPSRREEGDGLT